MIIPSHSHRDDTPFKSLHTPSGCKSLDSWRVGIPHLWLHTHDSTSPHDVCVGALQCDCVGGSGRWSGDGTVAGRGPVLWSALRSATAFVRPVR